MLIWLDYIIKKESFVLIRFSSNRESKEKDDLIKSTTN